MGTITVVGLGYIGLPLAVLLARKVRVRGVDVDSDRVAQLRDWVMPIPEKELQDIFTEASVRDNFTAEVEPAPADVFIVAVPTPLTADHKADLTDVAAGVESICPYLLAGNLVIVESTVPPLTCRGLVASIIERETGLNLPGDVQLAHCPERALPGDLAPELIRIDRVIGGMDQGSTDRAAEVYRLFSEGELLLTDDVTAELCKLAENAYRDVNIAFANELAATAEAMGCDPRRLIAVANHHPRVSILNPGIGVGGHCVPIDPWFIHQSAPALSTVIRTAREVNDAVPHRVADEIVRSVHGIDNPRIVLAGLTYKPDVPDLRESPALVVREDLEAKGYSVSVIDPVLDPADARSLTDASADADCLAILVEHEAFQRELVDASDSIMSSMRTPTVLRF